MKRHRANSFNKKSTEKITKKDTLVQSERYSYFRKLDRTNRLIKEYKRSLGI